MKSLELEEGERGIILAALLDFKSNVEHQLKNPRVAALISAMSENFGMDRNFTLEHYSKMIDGVIKKVKE